MLFIAIVVFVKCFQGIESNTSSGSTTSEVGNNPIIEPRTSAQCRPRPIIKDLGETSEEVYPRNIKLYQCSGFDGSPTTKNHMCVPTKRNEVKVVFYQYGEKTQQSFYNETECTMKCVCTLNGYQCPNNPHDVIVTSCPLDMNWDYNSCKCVPGLGSTSFNGTEKQWNGTGKEPDELIPTYPRGISVVVFVGSLVGEFLIMVAIGLVVYFYSKCRDKKIKQEEILMNGH